MEVAQSGIAVNNVAPGWIRTGSSIEEEKHAAENTPIRSPAEVAGLIAFLASDESTYITGQVIVIDGGNTTQDYEGPNEKYY
jgi:3-oxoacyl-[acyl-carrier protein] reductase